MLNRQTQANRIKKKSGIDREMINTQLSDQPEAAIQVCKVFKRFGKEAVLKDVTIELSKAQIHGVIGRNGSGKTVLLKCICGFLKVDQGMIRVLGQCIGRDCDFPKNAGVLIETPGFLPNESGRNNLKWLAQLGDRVPAARIDQVISLVGLDASNKKHVSKYSLGMRQRLGIAQALLNNPDLLVLDEPMNALDKQGAIEMRQLFLQLRDQGKTIILASHFAQDIDELCDSVYEMDQGALTRIR